ncbi:MAG: TauD/TfdA family dioxygenase [Alphaproteobacteria bacterium]|nr:TauD/TfdA family dioxygenase [Alphaproteobacteria bacterium]
MPITVEKLGQTFFAIVQGVDAQEPTVSEDINAIIDAIDDYGVLLFPGQTLNEEQHMAFSRQFGELEVTYQKGRKRRLRAEFADASNLGPDGELLAPDSERAKYNKANQLWHSDASFRAIPSKYSLLYAETAASKDGETEFADERAGWDALDDERKTRAEKMVAGHSLMTSRIKTGFKTFTAEEGVSLKPVPQPVVRTHDPKGRKNLFLGSHAGEVFGEALEEGTQFLEELLAHTTQPQFVYRHKWTVGDLVMWDNRRVMHRGRSWDESERRVMRRTTLVGDGPTVIDGQPINEAEYLRQEAS